MQILSSRTRHWLRTLMLTLMLTLFATLSYAQDAAGEGGETAAPFSCPRGDNTNTFAYYDAAANYCLVFPKGYAVTTTEDGKLLITTDNEDAPIQTELRLTIEPAAGQTLAEIQSALAEEFADTEVTIIEGALAGMPALIVTDIPGAPPSFRVILLREAERYTLTMTPYDEVLWRVVATSLHFPPPQATTTAPDAPPTPEECPTPTEATQLLYQPIGYYCLLYPMDFTAAVGGDSGGVFIIPSAAASSDAPSPTFIVTVNTAPDVTLDDIEDNLSDQLADLDPEFTRVTIGGVEAVVSDDLPGNIGSRQAFLLANNLLYLLTLTPIDDQFPETTAQAEALWATLTESFTLITPPVTLERPVIQTLFNARFGYSLIYPAGFQVIEQPDGSVELTQQTGTIDETQTRFSIFALPTEGRTLAEFQTEIEAQNPGLGLQFTTATIGGEPAIITDKLPTLAPSRQAFFIHEDTLFVLVLMPLDETLWQTLTDDFEFINVTQGSPMQASLDELGVAFLLPENWRLTQFGTTYYINSASGSIPLLTLRRDNTLPGGTDTAAFVARVQARVLPDTLLEGTTLSSELPPVLRAIPAAREQICQTLYLPRETFTLVLAVNRPACDNNGIITSAEVLRVLDSLTLYTPIE